VKLLIVDHFFSQDIEALRYIIAGHQLRVVSATLLSNVARKFFPASVFAGLLGEDYARPEYAEARRRYAVEACKILQSLYYTFPFDAVIIPLQIRLSIFAPGCPLRIRWEFLSSYCKKRRLFRLTR